MDIEDLVSSVEIADRLDLTGPELVHAWRRRHPDFPEPLTRLGITWIWSWDEIQAWATATGHPARRGVGP